jgi:hypothetical protein
MFAESVSRVQVDVEWSNKEGKDVRELMEQVLIQLLIYLFKSFSGPLLEEIVIAVFIYLFIFKKLSPICFLIQCSI